MSSDAPYYRLAGRIFADFSGTIAIPAVAGALFGKWLDTRYGTEPRYLLIFLTLALVITAFAIVKKAKKYTVQYESLMNRKN
ncbi:AtpZ/AtpI family protein [Candidatus Uhrbacteria bacterium]|nr:AtpZ/AtpI family protein [Candidatus Uhrbacteria bacterium]